MELSGIGIEKKGIDSMSAPYTENIFNTCVKVY